MQLIPKRKMQDGQANENTLGMGAQTIASSVVSYTETDRPLNTVFHNDTPRTKMIIASAYCQNIVYLGGVIGFSRIIAKTDAVTPPTTIVGQGGVNCQLPSTAAGDYCGQYAILTFFVLPNHYYTVATGKFAGGATPTFSYWYELTLRN
jgi:hypothetical protein